MKKESAFRIKMLVSILAFLCPFLNAYAQIDSPAFRVKHNQVNSSLNNGFAKRSGTVSRPGQSTNYSYSSGQWQYSGNSTYGYDAQGRLTSRLNLNTSGQNTTRQTYVYDSTNFIIYYTTDIWRNNMWTAGFGYRYLDVYDAAGNLTMSTYQERSGSLTGMGQWVDKHRWISTFNALNQQTGATKSNWDPNTNSWELRERQTNFMHNAANEVTSYLSETFMNGTWSPPVKYSDLVWEYSIGPMLSYKSSSLQNGNWVYFSHYLKVYDQNTGWTETVQNYQNGNWVNISRDTYERDTLGNDLGYKTERWQNGNWFYHQHNKDLLTYNANKDVTERISQLSQNNSQIYTNQSKWVYSNFQYYVVAGNSKETPKQVAISIFPNPTQNFINITLEQIGLPLNATLTDLSGKILLSQQFAPTQIKKLNLGQFGSGVYLLLLETEKGKTVQKIIKN